MLPLSVDWNTNNSLEWLISSGEETESKKLKQHMMSSCQHTTWYGAVLVQPEDIFWNVDPGWHHQYKPIEFNDDNMPWLCQLLFIKSPSLPVYLQKSKTTSSRNLIFCRSIFQHSRRMRLVLHCAVGCQWAPERWDCRMNQRGWRHFDVQPVCSNWKAAMISERWDAGCFSPRLLHAAIVPLLGLQVRQWAHYTVVTSRFRCFTCPRSATFYSPLLSPLLEASACTTTPCEVETSFAASEKNKYIKKKSWSGWSLELRLMRSGYWIRQSHLVNDNLKG